jgi:hypothetical protein
VGLPKAARPRLVPTNDNTLYSGLDLTAGLTRRGDLDRGAA